MACDVHLIRRYAWVTKPPVGVRALQPSRISLRFRLVVRARNGFGVMLWVILRLPLRITHRCPYVLHLIILRRPIHGAIIGYTLVNLVGLHFDFPLHFGVPLARYTSMSRYMLRVGVPLWVTLRRFTMGYTSDIPLLSTVRCSAMGCTKVVSRYEYLVGVPLRATLWLPNRVTLRRPATVCT